MKKVLCWFIVALMCISLIPQAVFANDAEAETEKTEEQLEVPETENTKELSEIPEAVETEENPEAEEKLEVPETEDKEEKTDAQKVEVTEEQVPEPEKEYNELGIEIGTMVHGEDISKLSEEELQYIPEGWRDGEIEESEHHEEPQKRTMMSTFSSYPNVNNYISSNKLSTAKIEYNHKTFFTRFNYRYGYGKAEGVVAHETANSNSTITGEINYMSNNHKNAFVHAFVDHNRIIEIHPPEMGAWGGGRFANQRFVHVELVRVHSFNDFAKSINNYADYIASLLYKFNLDVESADKNGKGTLWSHRAVSNFLGGTTHTDPHGYFSSWGYNWNDFVSLVTKKHKALSSYKEGSSSKLGHIKNSKVEIYPDLKRQYKFIKAGSTYTNSAYYIKRSAVLNGVRYYLISDKPSSVSGVIGWVKASDLNYKNHKTDDSKTKTLYFKGTGVGYSMAWGGSKNIAVQKLQAYKDQAFKVNLTESVGSDTWYRGTVNGKTIWVEKAHIASGHEKATSRLGQLDSKDVRIYSDYSKKSSYVSAGKENTNEVFYIKKKVTYNNAMYFLISRSPSSTTGVVGWVKSKDMESYVHKTVNSAKKTLYLKGSGKSYHQPWGGEKNETDLNLGNMKNRTYSINLTEKVGSDIWYRGKVDGQTLWIQESDTKEFYEKGTSRLGHLNNTKIHIYPDYRNQVSYELAGEENTGEVFYMKRKAYQKGDLYFLISRSPSSTTDVVGWVKSTDMESYVHQTVSSAKKTLYVKGNGKAYQQPWGGVKNETDINLAGLTGTAYKVNLTELVGKTTWYRGTVDGKTAWIEAAHTKSN